MLPQVLQHNNADQACSTVVPHDSMVPVDMHGMHCGHSHTSDMANM
jgi:hypothetical protein